MHEELDGVVLVASRLVLFCCDVQDPHAIRQCYPEVLMGGDPTVFNFWMNKTIQSGEWKLQGWVVQSEESRTSLGLDPSIPDTVDPCCYGFISLDPRGYGTTMIMH